MNPEVEAAYKAVLSDALPTSWLLVSGERNGTLTVKATGDGGLAQATAGFQDDQVQYAWVRLIRADGGGDSKRVKFVLLCWTGERSGVVAKSRVTEHRAWLGQHFTPTHVTLSLTERSGLDSLEADVDAALRAAGGADYDAGNAAAGVHAGGTATIKSASAAFFKQKDAETQLKGIQFDKHTRTDKKVSACDLGNRVMTASATEAKRNTVGYAAPKVAHGSVIASGSRPATETCDRTATDARHWRETPPPHVQRAPGGEESPPHGEDEVYEPGADGSEDSLEMPSD